ncbi:MAG TPA: hypothetical protein VH143_28965 [Kofleriaceae bacterium]|nr:hypothetical protein [Kofleriaceae bacterium]
MRRLASIIGLAACASPTTPSVAALDPATTGSASTTAAVVHGADLLAVPHVDLGNRPTTLDDAWSVLVDGVAIATAWQDSTALDVTIPIGLAVGAHDVVAVSPDGERYDVPGGLTIVGDTVAAATLAMTLVLPVVIEPATSFLVTAAVTNGSHDQLDVVPSALTSTGSGAATLVGGPDPAQAVLAAGSAATFTWTYSAQAAGSLVFAGSATGSDAFAQAVSNVAHIGETLVVASDPFGDGSTFAFANGYAGAVVLGPNDAGTEAARIAPDGSSIAIDTFALPADTIGTLTSNTSAAPYPSLGASGCAANSYACGPNDENGRGVFASAMLGGSEWLVGAGTRSSGNSNYLYFTSDTTAALGFRYVDLSAYMASGVVGWTAIGSSDDVVYAGAMSTNGARPRLVAVKTPPPSPGLDPAPGDVVDLRADAMPGMQSSGSTDMIDTIAVFDGMVYIANRGAWWRSTTATPADYASTPTDWAVVTPSAIAYTSHASQPLAQQTNLDPADRTVPQMAVFGGHLFAARNCVNGPQLWSCDPTKTGDASQCDPGDWSLVAPNVIGDRNLSQFDMPTLDAITLVVATDSYLYVGYDNPGGVIVYRTSNPSAALMSDFTGASGCSAAFGPSCPGYGGDGLGIAATQIFDAKPIAFGGSSQAWTTLGNGTAPIALVVLP